ncbi:hypothetical protein D3C85_252740 [compost metagenome]
MKTFINAIILGFFGAIAVTVSFVLQWPAWVMFLAWVSYYLFGRSIKTSIPIFSQIVLGIIMGLSIQLTAGLLTNLVGSLGFQAAVFLFIGSLAYLSKIKGLSSIPAWFIGLIILFGIHPEIEFIPIVSLLVPIIAGFLFAYLNDTALKLVSIKYNV